MNLSDTVKALTDLRCCPLGAAMDGAPLSPSPGAASERLGINVAEAYEISAEWDVGDREAALVLAEGAGLTSRIERYISSRAAEVGAGRRSAAPLAPPAPGADARYWAVLTPSAIPPSGGPFRDAPVVMTPGILRELEEEDAAIKTKAGRDCEKVTCRFCGNQVCKHYGCHCHKSDCRYYFVLARDPAAVIVDERVAAILEAPAGPRTAP